MAFSTISTLFLLAQLTANAPDSVNLLVRGGTVVTMDAERRTIEGGSIAIDGDRIVSIHAASEPLPAAEVVVDASGHLVIPGLVNTHGHVAMSLLRGFADDLELMDWLEEYIFPSEAEHVTEEFVYWGTLLGCVEMVLGGTTTFTDMYYFEDAVARAAIDVGLRGVLGQTIIGFPAPDHPTAAGALEATEAFLSRYAGHPLVIPSVAPHALYTTPLEIVRRAHDLAQRYGAPFQIHAAEAAHENDRVLEEYGQRTIALLDAEGMLGPSTILHHGVWLDDADIERIARGGASVSHNPESNMKTAAGVAPVPDLLAAGVAVGLGTDGPASNNNLDLFEEMDTAAKLHKLSRRDPTVLPAAEVFHMATRGGARALGLEGEIGSLEPGKRADLALIDLHDPGLTPLYDVYSHLVYAVKAADVRTVIVNGRIVVRDRQLTTVDVSEVMTRARELQVDILQSVPSRRTE